MKLTLLKILLLLFIFTSCNNDNNVKVKFKINKTTFERVKGKYLYLKNVDTKSIIDSLIVNQEDNQFIIPNNKSKFSEPYSVLMNDTIYANGVKIYTKKPLGYFNPYNFNEIHSTFYVEPKMNKIYLFTSIVETINGKKYLSNEFENKEITRKSISKQNDIFHKNIFLNFSDTNSDKRVKIISNNIEKIKKYPYSVILLKQLFNHKTNFRIIDLTNQLSYFDNDIKNTTLFKRLINYTNSNTSTFDISYPEFIELENEKGELKNIGNPKSKMNLLVYWSWWCGPCRKEIPYLRKLYKKYKDKGLTITSISIDPDKNKWFETLKIENMEWEQLIVSPSSLSELLIHFEIKSIPKSYLYDDKNRLIDKSLGFSETDSNKLKSYLIKLED